MVYADFYSRMWCSDYNDRYMSDDVYYYYVIPCLNRFDFINSYMDKMVMTDYSLILRNLPF